MEASLRTFWPSLALDWNDNPHISYIAWSGSVGSTDSSLKHAVKFQGVWSTETVDSVGLGCCPSAPPGGFAMTSLALFSGAYPRISYGSAEGLKLAVKDGVWAVESVASSVGYTYTSLAVGSGGTAHIIYVGGLYPSWELNYGRRWTGGADTTPPVLTVPGTITVNATSSAGAVVPYSVSATDNLDPYPAVSCTPPSGSTFPIGTTTVTCTATDASGNSATASFQIVVCAGAPSEPGPIRFTDVKTLTWAPTADATQWNTYRGTIPSTSLGSRLPGSVYDHVCFESDDAHGDGATTAAVVADPPPGTAFYFLVSAESSCGESRVGHNSKGDALPNNSPC